MDCFRLHVLGCGSALPTGRHNLSAQVLDVRGKLFLIDCGEGTQLQFRHTRLNYNKITDVFISHLHGDHCFGLIGLISTMSLLGRIAPLRLHAHADLEKVLRPQLDYFCRDLSYEVQFQPLDPTVSEKIYEDRTVQVWTLPLRHRVPCCGFLFREQPRQPHIIKEMIDFHQIPLRDIPAIKAGADFVKPDGSVVPNAYLTRPAKPTVSYAYCSDTAYCESLIPLLQGVDVLYHEATYGEDLHDRCEAYFHSSAAMAATLASRAGVGKLLLGHFSARYADEQVLLDEARAIFPNSFLSAEGLTVDIEKTV